MINFDEAVALVARAGQPLGTEEVPIASASGRVLASDVIARIDSPRSDVSAMDGYAVRSADLEPPPARLRIVGESFAGNAWDGDIGSGECARIFTGAAVPRGADWVVMQEDVKRDGDTALIGAAPGPARHIRPAGGDFRQGQVLLRAGRVLDPRAIVAAAGADRASVEVHRRPSLAILSTGDELAAPGTASNMKGAIPESVSFGVAALAEQWGGITTSRTRLRDELPAMTEAAGEALQEADLVVVTGGASVGERDFAKTMFEPHGLELLFSKVAIKPGKPVWLSTARERLVMGLPGNPTSALVTARLLLAPLLAVMTGRPAEQALCWRSLPLANALGPCGGRETFHRARLTDRKAEILSFQDSSAQMALAEADLLVRQRAGTPALAAGEMVEVLDF